MQPNETNPFGNQGASPVPPQPQTQTGQDQAAQSLAFGEQSQPAPASPVMPGQSPASNDFGAAPPPPQPQFGVTPEPQPQPQFQPQAESPQSPQPAFGQPAPAYGGQPAMTASAQHGGSKGKFVMIAIVGVVILALLGGLAWWLLGSGNNPISSVVNNVTGGSDVTDRNDGTLDLGSLIDKDVAIKSQSLTGKLNQQINLSDGLSYMVTKVERDVASPSKFVKVDAGKELIKVTLVVGNRAKSGDLYVYSSTFQVKNSAGGLQASEFITDDEATDVLSNVTVNPGKQTTGTLFFMVDKGEAVSLATEAKYQRIGGSETATLTSEVALQ